MAPITRSMRPRTPPNRVTKACESDTIKRKDFYYAYDSREAGLSDRAFFRDFGINRSTGLLWLRQRRILGSPAYRRTRQYSSKLGRPSKLSKESYKMLVSPSRNPVRNQHYEAQIEFHKLDVKPRTIQRNLKRYTEQGQRYKQAYVSKTLSKKNRQERIDYGEEHKDKTIEDFWQYIIFTDEAHIDPTSTLQGYILREEGQRYDSENIQERGEKKGVKLHIAAWINWHKKADKLEFYNDEQDSIIRPKRPPRPRKTMYESEDEFQHRLDEWNASLPHEHDVKPKGNAMTQKYYCERLLPVYIDAMHQFRLQDPQDWLLQEDNDPSHGSRKKGLAQHLKESNWVENLVHPARSPDLNPMEAVWNILKQRVGDMCLILLIN
jgi:hypothetical protein